MSDFIHWLAHKFGSNTGKVVTKIDADGYLWIGFECDKCGAICGRHRRVS